MNHNCHGDYSPEHRVYRCLAGSDILADTDLPTVCPFCDRNVSAVIHKNARRFKRVQDVIEFDESEFVIAEGDL